VARLYGMTQLELFAEAVRDDEMTTGTVFERHLIKVGPGYNEDH